MKHQRSGGFLIAKIHQLSGRIFTKILKEHQIEINPAQGRIMFALWKQDNITIQELATKTSLSKSTLTPMLDRLEKMDYIKRIPSKDDRRKILIALTDKDKQLQEKYLQVSQEMNDIFYEGLSMEQIDYFEQTLQNLYENLLNFDKK